ncbi:MAG TPA: Na+/H+ antiporter [Thermoanaerobaculia bacterium]|nr:Na+/H+ antiporter [Thermoanaerobaculia bacterium]
MHPVETILALLVPTTVLAVLAKKISVPYPIVLVIGGSLLAFIPGLPAARLDPQLVFLLFLPPILYAAAYFTSWRDFRDNLLSISLLAVGLVAATTAAVAVAFHAVVPGVGWPAAFVLGAIVSPPDAVAATAIAQRLRLPRRIVTILEGESLVNDATGLVLLKFATAAAVTGAFSAGGAAFDFGLLVAGGIAVGAAAGVAFAKLERLLDDSVLAATASLLVSFVVYILAERLHVSGVLAVVTAGLIQGRAVPRLWTPKMRVEATAFWDTVVFVLNALLFVLIGLQLPSIAAGLSGLPRGTVVDAVFATLAAAVGIRLVWMFPGAYLPRLLIPAYAAKSPKPPWQWVLLVGWTGMRGIVSLAAALALPVATASGAPFPGRDLILIVTFAVIFGTLVVQGLTLPSFIGWLAIGTDVAAWREERQARRALAEAGLSRVDALAEEHVLPAHQIHAVRQELVDRLRQLVPEEPGDPVPASTPERVRWLRSESLTAQRERLLELRQEESIGDDTLHRLQHELDLEEMRSGG